MGVTRPRPLQETDDLSVFDCGQSSLNKWLRDHALRNQKSGVSRTNVVCDSDKGHVVGFVSISAATIERASLKRKLRHGKPDPIPMTLLGQLGVDQHYRGKRLGESLLYFALNTAKSMAEHVGSLGVITHPLNAEARNFYLHYGFEDIPGDDAGAMLLRMVDIEASGF